MSSIKVIADALIAYLDSKRIPLYQIEANTDLEVRFTVWSGPSIMYLNVSVAGVLVRSYDLKPVIVGLSDPDVFDTVYGLVKPPDYMLPDHGG